ncbi:hypothetical protein SADUNF_Sadunf16G0154400 [Salix dunnii]|uniref:Uncharacterized protein n=1 Tax=Salix dunnii TaxID=1413687 RepID=A0A835J6Z4_9ROSI|nr:hypothetical protein SADUNF_Sadunf16G0154400 [Salix dunnii]
MKSVKSELKTTEEERFGGYELKFVAVSAQDIGELAPAPAPAVGKGAASYSLGTSGALICCSSLFLSMLALLRH